MTPGRTAREIVPEPVVRVLDEFRREFSLDVHLWEGTTARDRRHLYPPASAGTAPLPDSILLAVPRRRHGELTLEVRTGGEEQNGSHAGPAANALRSALEYLYEYADEVRDFAHEMADRYEEINLLYSISEILGSLLHLRDASHTILSEVCDVLGARRGSLWVLDGADGALNLVASVGDDGLEGPLDVNDPTAVTAQVFREGRPVILSATRFELIVPELGNMAGSDRDPAGSQELRGNREARGKARNGIDNADAHSGGGGSRRRGFRAFRAHSLHAAGRECSHRWRHQPDRPTQGRALHGLRPEAPGGHSEPGGCRPGEQSAFPGRSREGKGHPRDGAGPRPADETSPDGRVLRSHKGRGPGRVG
jgi:hypothetical protein